MTDSYTLTLMAKAEWPDTSWKESTYVNHKGSAEDISNESKRMADQAVAEALDTKAKSEPTQINVWHKIRASYADGREAERKAWLNGNKSVADALRASAQWAEKNLKELVEIGSDDV